MASINIVCVCVDWSELWTAEENQHQEVVSGAVGDRVEYT